MAAESATLPGYARGTVHAVKWITFLGHHRPIILQNENGPCPIISLVNVLLLLGRVTLGAHFQYVDNSWILHHLRKEIERYNNAQSADANMRHLLKEVIELLPALQVGMDVNVRFGDCEGFEFTPALSVYDLTGVRLMHGWVVEEGELAHELLRDTSFNAATDRVIRAFAAKDDAAAQAQGTPVTSSPTRRLPSAHAFHFSQEALAALRSHSGVEHARAASTAVSAPEAGASPSEAETKMTEVEEESGVAIASVPGAASPAVLAVALRDVPPDDSKTDAAAPRAQSFAQQTSAVPPSPAVWDPTLPLSALPTAVTPATAPAAAAAAAVAAAATAVEGSAGDKPPAVSDEELENASIIDTWLRANASQLTMTGLQQLHARMQENELTVFFRNNHFATMFKSRGKLYLLATDEGFKDVPEVVWERLDDVTGDTVLVDGLFAVPFEVASQSYQPAAAAAPQHHGSAHSAADLQLPDDFHDLSQEEQNMIRAALAASAAPSSSSGGGGGGGGGGGEWGSQPTYAARPEASSMGVGAAHAAFPHPAPTVAPVGNFTPAPAPRPAAPAPASLAHARSANDRYGRQADALRQAAMQREARSAAGGGGGEVFPTPRGAGGPGMSDAELARAIYERDLAAARQAQARAQYGGDGHRGKGDKGCCIQ